MRAPRLLRRTTFAASLVVTIGATAACGGKSKPHIATNPPPIDERGPGAWKQQGDSWVYAYDNGDQVWLGEDGQCRLIEDDHCGEGSDGDKPEIISCNPPPPQDVECPPGKP